MLRKTRDKPRRSDGRVQHVRQKRKRGDRTAEEARHIARVAALPCMMTGQPAEVHHLLVAPGKRAGRDHRWVVPLAPALHRQDRYSVHGCGSEALFEWTHGLTEGLLIQYARALWESRDGVATD